MPIEPAAALLVWHELPPGEEAGMSDWYNREHHPERLALPGFRSVRRYEALGGPPAIFSLYLVGDLGALTSPEYLRQLQNPTEGTQRWMPRARNMSRTVCRVLQRLGTGEGGALGCWRLAPQPGREAALTEALQAQVLPEVAARPDVVHTMLLRGDRETSLASSQARKTRNAPDVLADTVIVVGANAPEAVERVRQDTLGDAHLSALGAAAEIAFGPYRLVYRLAASPGE